jgi:hypothetical protein
MSVPAVGDMVACTLDHTGLSPCLARAPSRVTAVYGGGYVETAAGSTLDIADLRIVARHRKWGAAPVRIMSELRRPDESGGQAYRVWHVHTLAGGHRSEGYARVSTALSYAGAVATIDHELKAVRRAVKRRERRITGLAALAEIRAEREERIAGGSE